VANTPVGRESLVGRQRMPARGRETAGGPT
jgi:hypothetical protein